MVPLKRKPVDKYADAKRFDRKTDRVKAINVKPAPMRGGIRL